MTRYEQLQAEQAEKRKKLNARKIGVDNLATLKDEREDVPTSIRARIDADIAKGREAEAVKQKLIAKEREDQDKYTSKYVPSTNVLDVMKSKVDSAMGVDSTKMVPNKTPHVSDINRSAANVDYSREAVAAKEQFIRENPTIGMTPLEKATYNAQKYNPLAVSDMLVNKAGAGAVQFGAELADAAIAPLKGSGAVYPTAQTTKELWSKQEPGNALTDYISNAKKTLGTVQAARTDYYLNGGTLQDKADSYTAKLDAKFANLTDTAVTKALSDLSQSIGYMVPVQIANMILPNAGTALLYASGYASGERQALQAGGTPDEAKAYAYLNGLNQSLGEMLVGGVLGKGAGAIDTLLKKAGVDIASKIANPTIKAWANAIVRALGESAEEVIQGLADVAAQRATYNPDAAVSGKELAYEGLLGGLMDGVYEAAAGVKRLALPSVQQLAAENVQATFAERNAPQTNRAQDFYNSRIADIKSRETDLFGRLRTAEEDEIFNRLTTAKNNTEKSGILAGASDETIAAASRTAEAGKVDILFFNEGRTESGNIIDGYEYGGKLYVNSQSPRAVEFILGHELTHAIEKAKSYDKLGRYVLNRMGTDAVAAERQRIGGIRTAEGQQLTEAEIDREIVADFAGKNLLNNEADIVDIVRADRTLAEKIRDWLSDMIKRFTGTAEEKFYARARSLYIKALAEARQNDMVRATAAASVSTDTSVPLRTLNNSKIARSAYGVGKDMAGKIYVHKDYATEIVPTDIWEKAKSIAGDFKYNTIVYNAKTPNIVRFDEAPTFDTDREPYPGNMLTVNIETGETKNGYNNQIWHHKWQWVKDSYKGFDVQESYNWSKRWLNDITNPSGIYGNWKKDLRNSGLPYDTIREGRDVAYDREHRDLGEREEFTGMKAWGDSQQTVTSAGTSINSSKTPKLLGSKKLQDEVRTLASKQGNVVIADLGGGKFDNAKVYYESTEFLNGEPYQIGKQYTKDPNNTVTFAIYDRYNRTGDYNDRTISTIRGGKADIVTINNVTNVIDSRQARAQLYLNAADAVKSGGTVYISPYVGDKSGVLKYTQGGQSAQLHRVPKEYIKETERFFNYVTATADTITAREPVKDATQIKYSVSDDDTDTRKVTNASPDAIAYDDSGNVIPLSQRFNPDNPDIRYSVSEDNSEYFRKKATAAKIRAEQIKDIETWEEPNGKYANRYNDEMTEKRLDNELKELEDEQTETPDPLTLPSVKQKNPLEIDNVKELLSETNDLPPVTEEMEQEYEFAKGMVGNGISYNRDISRNLDSAAGKNKALRDKLHELIEKPFYVAKKNYADEVSTRLNKLKLVMDKLGIKQGSKESAAVQWIGEGSKQGIDGKPVPYTEADLTRDFPKTYKKILTAERYCRELYSEYIGRINQALEKVYPNAVENVTREQIKYASAEMFYAGQADLLGEQIKTLESTIAKKEAELSKAKPETTKYVTLKTSINYNKNRVETKKRVLDKYKAISERSGVLARQLQKDIDTGDALRNKRLMPRKDYYHHFNEIESGFGGLVNLISTPSDIDSLLAGTSEFTKPKSKWAGFLQQRQNGKYTEDAVGGLTKYIPAAEYKIALDPIIAEGRAHIQGIATATTETRNANKFLTWYTDFVNSLAGKTNPFDRVVQKVASRKALAVLRFINTRAKKNAVVGNVRSAIAQFFNLPNAAGLIKNPVDWMAGGKLFTENLIGRPDATALLDASGFLTERYLDSAIRQFDESILKSPSKLFAWMLEAGDKQAAKLIWSAAYSNATRTKKADPILYADDITRRTVAGRGIGEVPLAQQAIITQFVAPFQIEVNNAWQLLKDKWRDKDIYGIFAIFLMSWLMNSLVRELFGFDVSYDPINAAHESIKEWDSKSTTYDNVMNVAGRQAGELISNIPFGSTVSQYVISDEYQREKLFGDSDPTRFGTGNIGLNMFVDPIIEIINGDDYTDELLSAVLNLTLPYGGKQAEKTLKGLQDIGIAPRVSDVIGDNKAPEIETKAGSYSASGGLRLSGPEQPADIAKTLVLGSLSTKAGQEYLESDSRPLSDKNTEIYEKVTAAGANGLYVNKVIRETQSKDKSEDKRDTLMSSPLNPDHKLLLYRQMLVQDEWNEAKLIDRLSGMTSSQQVLDTIVKYKDLNASKMKAGEKALDWQLWVDKQGFSATQKAAIDEYISFRVALPVEPTAYEKFTESGMDVDTAYDLADSISKLEPMEGQKAVSTLQRYRVIADAEISDKDKLRAMSVLMSETGYKALAKARLKGLKIGSYVQYLEGTADIVSDTKNGETVFGSRKQKVLTLIDRMILTKAQKDLLYDIEGYSAGTIDDAPWHGGERYDGDIHQRKVNGRQLRPLS